jgi:hypothetical protein
MLFVDQGKAKHVNKIRQDLYIRTIYNILYINLHGVNTDLNLDFSGREKITAFTPPNSTDLYFTKILENMNKKV